MSKRPSLAALAWLARSLLIYYAIPGRAHAWRRFYRQFVSAGDLCFDIGAHVGNRSAALLALGVRVVACEPQPLLARTLQRFHGRNPNLTILPVALGAAPGRTQMLISTSNPTLSTLSADWANDIGKNPDFAGTEWDQRVEVELTTLDALIAQYGSPVFCKIDVEGYELDVLRGLSQPLQLLSFEYLPPVIGRAFACLDRLTELGDYRFNLIESEFPRFALAEWANAQEIAARLKAMPSSQRAGEIFAQLSFSA